MIKALNLFNAVLLALAATFFLTLGVVWIIYAFYLDATPRMRGEWVQLGRVTLVFAGLMACAGAAFLGQRRGLSWRWLAQGVLVVFLAIGMTVLIELLG